MAGGNQVFQNSIKGVRMGIFRKTSAYPFYFYPHKERTNVLVGFLYIRKEVEKTKSMPPHRERRNQRSPGAAGESVKK